MMRCATAACRLLCGAHADARADRSAICAEAILFLAGPKAPCTTGHLIPVDGGLTEAFLR